jgi:hypothetical protein
MGMEVEMFDLAVNAISLQGLLAFGKEKDIDSFVGEVEIFSYGEEVFAGGPTERRLLYLGIETDPEDCDGFFYEPWGCWDWEY